MLRWAAHRHAPIYLGLVSFSESSFFPIPPDVMLAPMVLARRQQAWWLAGLTTITSVLGGIAGYLIGKFLFDEFGQAIIDFYHAQAGFERVKLWFHEYGVMVVFVAGFSPIPYKLFTVASGVLGLAFVPFAAASVVGRGMRFYLVSGLLYWGGQPFEEFLRRRIDILGWGVVGLAAIAYLLLR